MEWHLVGWMVLASTLAVGVSLLCAWLILRSARQQMVSAVHYLFDRITLLGTEVQRISEDMLVLKEMLERRGLVDSDELARLHQEIIEIPRQRQAEHEQLLDAVKDEDKKERMVRNVPDVLQ